MENPPGEPSKYKIEIEQGKGVAIGDHATVNIVNAPDQQIAALLQAAIKGQADALRKLIELIGKIEGQEQEIRHVLTMLTQASAGHRGVQISGDVTQSIIITGDGNQIQLSDGGRLARWWQEIGPDPSALLPQYLARVADAYAPLFFPLAHLSQPIPLHEVYVDLPIIKPQTEETLFRPLHPGQRLSGEQLREADELLQRSDRAALVGIMGAGKTTALRYLAWSYAQRTPLQVSGQDDTLVPFYAPLRDLAELWNKTERDSPQQFIRHLAKAVSIAMAGIFPAQILEGVLQLALEQGNALILLDALDEFRASDQERSGFVTSLQTLLSASPLFKNNHVLMTSRPYRFFKPLGFEQYAVQDLQDPERLVSRLGRAILNRVRSSLSDEQMESWLELLNGAISSPRLRELSNPIYLTMMAYLGTSRETAAESVSLIKSIERPADPYRYFLLRTIDWEKQKGNEPHIESDQALLVLGYAGYYSFVDRAMNSPTDRIAADLPTFKNEIPATLEFWKRTGLLEENELRSELSFCHSSFEAFAVALALRDMVLRSKAQQVNKLWEHHRWDATWQTIWELFMSLGGREQR